MEEPTDVTVGKEGLSQTLMKGRYDAGWKDRRKRGRGGNVWGQLNAGGNIWQRRQEFDGGLR